MSVRIIDQTFDRKLWNARAPHPLQSWEWGEARSKMGLKVVRIGEFKNESLINTFLMTIHQLPFGKRIGYLPRSVYPSQEVLMVLEDFAKQNNLIFIKLEPYEQSSKSKIQDAKLVKSPHALFPEWTITIDLTKSEEELLKSLKPKTRYNMRLAQKKGVVVREMTDEKGFEIFQKLYFETADRQKYFGHNLSYHHTIFETLKNNIAHILIAFHEDEPLAAYEVFIFNGVLYYTYGGSGERKRNIMAPNLLMWETILFGKKYGARTFDMWNSLPPDYPQNHPWAGFTRFKEGYGGKFVHLTPSRDLVINSLLYNLYNLVYTVRNWLLTR